MENENDYFDIFNDLTISENDNTLISSIENNRSKLNWINKRMKEENCENLQEQISFFNKRVDDLTEDDYKDICFSFLIGDLVKEKKEFFILEIFYIISRIINQLQNK